MLLSNQKTSLQVPFQLPAYIRDDPNYANFVLFLQAYYEWLEQQDNVTDVSKNLLNYKDIDSLESANVALSGSSAVVEQFIDYFENDFLSYFPTNILANQTEVIKLAKQLYQSKGTPASYKFLFRILYNSDVDFFNTKDAVLKASSGTWYIPKNLNVGSVDATQLQYWSNLAGLKIVGLTSKAIAVIENTVITPSQGVEVFLTELDRDFESGETVNIIDKNNQFVYDPNNNQFQGQIVGQLGQIAINPNYRGLYYKVGDPVVVYGGLFFSGSAPATAQVSGISQGSIQSINVLQGGYGYTANPNTTINLTNAPGASAAVASLNPANSGISVVALLPTDALLYVNAGQGPTIGNTTYSFFANNSTANANTSLANTFSFTSFTTYPISAVGLVAAGSGITQQPTVTATSGYQTTNSAVVADLSDMGILAPIQIINPGLGYHANDIITITGGSGYGAHANVLSVNANGAITSVGYTYSPLHYTPLHHSLGGMGYRPDQLPTVTITTSNTSPATLSVPGILGTGATFYTTTDRAGAVSQIQVTYGGTEYIATPNVSLTVQDLLVTGISAASLPKSGATIYQGTNYSTATYKAQVSSVTAYTLSLDPLKSVYTMRVYNYSAQPSTTTQVKVLGTSTVFNIASSLPNSVTTYGDGTAQATATFLNGLNVGKGQYLDNSGQLSSYDVLQSTEYNNYTYEITLEKEISAYKKILLNLLHPSGTQVLGRYKMTSSNTFNSFAADAFEGGHNLSFYTGTTNTLANVQANFVNQSNNIITFTNLYGANLASFINTNSSILLTTSNGFTIASLVANVNYTSNTVTLVDNTWLTFANVAYVTANAGSNVININTLTGSYDIINNGQYSNTAYPLYDIVYAGDKVQVNNQIAVVSSIDYPNGRIKLANTLTYGISNGFMSVNRTVSTDNVKIYGPLGTQYFPEILTEDGRIILTEDGNILLLG
jgi:hypothetical protein